MYPMCEGMYMWDNEFPEDGPMPCKTYELRGKMAPYLAPNTLGKAEDEEAAMRIVYPSVFHGAEWMGVTWEYIVRQMQREYEANRRLDRAMDHNAREKWRTKERRELYWLLSVVTLGIYRLFAKYPQPDLVEVPKNEAPFSVIPVVGPEAIINSIRKLVARELVKVRVEDGKEVLFPTPKLVQALAC